MSITCQIHMISAFRAEELLMEPLVKRLAIPLGNQKTVSKWLVMAGQPYES